MKNSLYLISGVITSGNLITDISDHLVQFLITPKVLENEPNIMINKRCFKKVNEGLFANYFQNTGLQTIHKTYLNDINFSFSQFILKINELLDTHVPFKYFKPNMKKNIISLGLQVIQPSL